MGMLRKPTSLQGLELIGGLHSNLFTSAHLCYGKLLLHCVAAALFLAWITTVSHFSIHSPVYLSPSLPTKSSQGPCGLWLGLEVIHGGKHLFVLCWNLSLGGDSWSP